MIKNKIIDIKIIFKNIKNYIILKLSGYFLKYKNYIIFLYDHLILSYNINIFYSIINIILIHDSFPIHNLWSNFNR